MCSSVHCFSFRPGDCKQFQHPFSDGNACDREMLRVGKVQVCCGGWQQATTQIAFAVEEGNGYECTAYTHNSTRFAGTSSVFPQPKVGTWKKHQYPMGVDGTCTLQFPFNLSLVLFTLVSSFRLPFQVAMSRRHRRLWDDVLSWKSGMICSVCVVSFLFLCSAQITAERLNSSSLWTNLMAWHKISHGHWGINWALRGSEKDLTKRVWHKLTFTGKLKWQSCGA